jgi:hypothetical protein
VSSVWKSDWWNSIFVKSWTRNPRVNSHLGSLCFPANGTVIKTAGENPKEDDS